MARVGSESIRSMLSRCVFASAALLLFTFQSDAAEELPRRFVGDASTLWRGFSAAHEDVLPCALIKGGDDAAPILAFALW